MEIEIKSKWNEIINYLKTEFGLSDVVFRTWILPLEVESVKDGIITISIDDSKIGDRINYISTKYELNLQVSIEEITGYHLQVEFILKSSLFNKEETHLRDNNLDIKEYPFLATGHTFDTFVVSGNNSMAHAASVAVAESPGNVYNPLYIYGGPGLGKTHLMHAIATYIHENHPSLKVIYKTSEEFTNEVIDAIRTNKNKGDTAATAKFKSKYRNTDVFLVDDIQFIIGKDSSQQEFFHTFNSLYESGKQIIISSDKAPRDMEILEERLRSRFGCGITVDIQPPDYETRMAILKQLEEQESIQLDDVIITYIATNIKTNIRDLQGAFNRILLLSRLKHEKITIELAREALKDVVSPLDKTNITIPLIVEVVSEHFNLPNDAITSSKKSKNIAYPRQICMYLCRRLTDSSFQDIAASLGGRDHSTISYGASKIEESMKNDESLSNTIDILIKKINPQ